jgi:hypothetical protein
MPILTKHEKDYAGLIKSTYFKNRALYKSNDSKGLSS